MITTRLKQLAKFSDDEGGLTRLSLSPSHKAAYTFLKSEFEKAGLKTRSDGLGSLIGRLEGQANKTLIIGSHIDTVKNAGIYDGNLGVLLGLMLVEKLQKEGIKPSFSLEIHAFADEEGVRFPTTLSNSRLLAGQFDPKILDDKDENGITRREALTAFGEDISCVKPHTRKDIIGCLEVHIEQGPVLESENLALGVVTAINGATRGKVKVSGSANHAGTTPMHLRHDAITAAAEMVLAVESYAQNTEGLVATTGVFTPKNAAVNVISGEVEFTLDMRSPSDEIREKAASDIKTLIETIAKKRQVKAETVYSYHAKAAPCDARLQNYLESALAKQGLKPKRLPSGAGHDSMAFKGVYPFAMLFVRSKNGLSHHPDEFSSEKDCQAALDALYHTILNLSQSEASTKNSEGN
jgi:allantoate deiminase